MKALIKRQTNLPAHVVQISRFLRTHGFQIGPKESLELLTAFESHIPISFEEQQNIYRSIFVKNRKQFLIFAELYEDYWNQLSRAEDSKTKDVEEKTKTKKNKPKQEAPSLKELKNWLYNGKIEEEKEVATYSAFEAISNKDFSTFLSSDRKEIVEIIRIIARRLANKNSRRYIRSRNQKLTDLKNTIRKALRNGGEINRFIFKEKQKKKVNLILICDVSKSMELYSQFLIEFMYNFQQTVFELKTFVFSTRLISLTRILRDGNYEKVLENLSEQVPHWSGGTRIGESLLDFKTKYGSHLLNKDSMVLILSDGWDTGDLEILEHSMKFIHKKCHRVIWLNPLAGNLNYQPETKAMKICLPYIDVFSAAHNVDSLKKVARYLKI